MNSNNNCLYFHRKPNGEIFYVGIGKDYRPFDFVNARNRFWHSIVKKYGLPKVEIILSNISWQHACYAECWCIRMFGRRDLNNGTLVNLTDGGDGVISWGTFEERSLNAKNRIGNDEKAALMRSKITPEIASKRSYKRWQNFSEEMLAQISEKISLKAKERWKLKTQEEKDSISEKRINSMTPEQRSLAAKKGKQTMTSEQRSDAAKKSWITRKLKNDKNKI